MKSFVVLALLWGCAWAAAPCDTVFDVYAAFYKCVKPMRYSVADNPGIVNQLDNMCGAGGSMATFVTCFKDTFSSCSADYKAKVADWATQYESRVCEDGKLLPKMDVLKRRFECLFNESSCLCDPPVKVCNFWSHHEVVQRCYNRLGYGQFFNVSIGPKTMDYAEVQLKRYARQVVRCIRRRTDFKTECEEKNRNATIYYHLYAYIPPGPQVTIEHARAPQRLNPGVGPRSTVTLFGDPHVRCYAKKKDFETCGALGDTSALYHPEYLNVTVHNRAVGDIEGASVMDSIRVEILDQDGNVEALYTAEDGRLPANFQGGKDVITSAVDGSDITVKTRKENHIQIHSKRGEFAILIGAYKDMYPLVTVRMANHLLDDGEGLMVDCCADPITLPSTRRRKRATDCSACDAEDDAAIRKSCIFDCDSTGDVGMALAGNPKEAENDLMEFEPSGGAPALSMVAAILGVVHATYRAL